MRRSLRPLLARSAEEGPACQETHGRALQQWHRGDARMRACVRFRRELGITRVLFVFHSRAAPRTAVTHPLQHVHWVGILDPLQTLATVEGAVTHLSTGCLRRVIRGPLRHFPTNDVHHVIHVVAELLSRDGTHDVHGRKSRRKWRRGGATTPDGTHMPWTSPRAHPNREMITQTLRYDSRVREWRQQAARTTQTRRLENMTAQCVSIIPTILTSEKTHSDLHKSRWRQVLVTRRSYKCEGEIGQETNTSQDIPVRALLCAHFPWENHTVVHYRREATCVPYLLRSAPYWTNNRFTGAQTIMTAACADITMVGKRCLKCLLVSPSNLNNANLQQGSDCWCW